MLSIFIVARQVEIESAGVDDQDWSFVDDLKVGLDGDLILIELLHAWVTPFVPLLTINL